MSFDASSSSASDGSSLSSYQWDFDGDGNYDGSGETTSHRYNSTGNFNVKLRVTDDDSNTDTVSKYVNVSVNTSSTNFNLSQNNNKTSDTDTQYFSRIREVKNLGSGFVSNYSVNSPSMPGSLTNSPLYLSLNGSSSKNATFKSKGDFISSEKAFNLSNASGTVEYGAFDSNYSVDQVIKVSNDRSDLDLDVDLDPAIPSTNECVVSSSSEFTIASNSTENNSITKSCDPADEQDYSLTKSISDNKSIYTYNGTVEVYSNRTDDVKHEYWAKLSRFTDFSNKDASSVNYSIDGIEKGLNVSVKSRSGSDYLVLTALTNRTNSSVHEGTRYYEYEYAVADSNSGSVSGGSVVGSSGGDQEQVTESPYEWGVTLVDSDFVGIFKPSVRPGESFEREIVVNSDESDLTIDVDCESDGSACEWVSSDLSTIEFDDDGRTVVTVRGQVPEDANKNTFRFDMVFTDPAFEEGSGVGKNTVRFVVSTDSPWDFLFNFWDNLVGTYNGVPIAFFGFITSMLFFVPAWAVGRLESYPKIVPTVAVLIFLITVGVI